MKRRKLPGTFLQERIYGLFFSSPAILLFLFIIVLTSLLAIVYSFTNYALAGSNANNFRFIGLDNYFKLLNDDIFFNSVIITLAFTFWSTLFTVIISFFIAAITYQCNKIIKSILTIVFLLGSIFPVSVSINLFINVFHFKYGLLAYIPFLKDINWFSDRAFETLVICNLWLNLGWIYLLHLSAFDGIPRSTLEVMEIDNLDFIQKLRFIYFPYLKNVIMVTILFSAINGLKTFIISYSLTNGGPGYETEFLSLYAYKKAFVNFNLGYGTAVSVMLLFLIVLLGIPLSIAYRKQKNSENQDES